jgi:hypothetical protein
VPLQEAVINIRHRKRDLLTPQLSRIVRILVNQLHHKMCTKTVKNVGYILEMDYYLYDQITSAIIALPGLTFTETLQTTSNPDNAQFTPPDNTPATAHSDATGKMIDLLYAYYPFGLPQGFTASRSQSLTANGFLFTPTQQQSYGQSTAAVATQNFSRTQ